MVCRLWLRNGTGVALMFVEDLVDSRGFRSTSWARCCGCAARALAAGPAASEYILAQRILPTTGNMRTRSIDGLLNGILFGSVVLPVDGCVDALNIDIRKLPERSVEEPTVEAVIRGPRDGLTEDFQTNISLIRRRLPGIRFKVEKLGVGRVTHAQVG